MKPTLDQMSSMHALWVARISSHLLSNARNRCETSPTDCRLWHCHYIIVFPQLNAMIPRIHLLYPLTLVRGIWEDVMSQAHSFITSSWTFYLQADDGKVVIFQVCKEKAITVFYKVCMKPSSVFYPLLNRLNLKSSFSVRLSWKEMLKRTQRKAVGHQSSFCFFFKSTCIFFLHRQLVNSHGSPDKIIIFSHQTFQICVKTLR